MSFVSLAKEFNDSKKVVIDATFIFDYMPLAPENFVKVYLAAFAFANNKGATLDEISAKLDLEYQKILDAFKFWEQKGLVEITYEPLNITFNKIAPISKQVLKFDKAKYQSFNEQLHRIINGRQISLTEYNEYYTLMEGYGLEESALLNIIGYCKRLKKDDNINHRYIIAVAYDFIEKGYRTFESVNEHIEKTVLYETDLIDIYKALKIKKIPDYLDKQLIIKWKNEFGFTIGLILDIAKLFTKNTKGKISVDKFDTELTLYNKHRLTTLDKIEEFVTKKIANIALAKEFTTILGIFEPYEWAVKMYFEPWLKLGFSSDVLLAIANNCRELPYYQRSLKSIADKFIIPFANEKQFSVEEIEKFFANEKESKKEEQKNKKSKNSKADNSAVAKEGNKNFVSRDLSSEELNSMFERINDDDL